MAGFEEPEGAGVAELEEPEEGACVAEFEEPELESAAGTAGFVLPLSGFVELWAKARPAKSITTMKRHMGAPRNVISFVSMRLPASRLLGSPSAAVRRCIQA